LDRTGRDAGKEKSGRHTKVRVDGDHAMEKISTGGAERGWKTGGEGRRRGPTLKKKEAPFG